MSALPRIISALLLTLLLAACGRGGARADRALNRAEALLELHPDSALTILDSLSATPLPGRERRARHALLLTMALDKNFIDKTDFGVIAPAVDYYLRGNGNANEQLRTLYYQGRIYQNAGDLDNAQASFLKGEQLFNEATDTLAMARLISAQARIFKAAYEFPKFIDKELKTASLLKSQNYNEDYICSMLSALDGSMLSDNKHLSDSLYQLCSNLISHNPEYQNLFLPYNLAYQQRFGTQDSVGNILRQIKPTDSLTIDELMTVADNYTAIGKPDVAFEILNSLDTVNADCDHLKFSGIKFLTLEAAENYEDALEELKTYNDLMFGETVRIYDEKFKLLDLRHNLEIDQQKQQNKYSRLMWISLACAIFVIAAIIVAILMLKSARTKRKLQIQILKQRISSLEEEREALSLLLSHHNIPEEARNTVIKRIDILNELLRSKISGTDGFEKKHIDRINEIIVDTNEFMNSNRLVFEATHPEFIAYFRNRNLTTDEINYVCLYALGLQGKNIGLYLKKPSHVHISSDIRKKLGLGVHDTNLGKFVLHILAKN